MKIKDWYKKAWKNITNFSTRAGRREYWYFMLGNMLFSTCLFFLFDGELNNLWTTITLIPSITVAIRRLHDTNHSGWNILWIFLPLFGHLYYLYLVTLKSDEYENQYGLPELDNVIYSDFIELEREVYNFKFKD